MHVASPLPCLPTAAHLTESLESGVSGPWPWPWPAGCEIAFLGRNGCLPLRIRPTGLRGGAIQLSAALSSQYVSSVLLAAPLASSPVALELVGPSVVSEPYIAMTVRMMQAFGASVRHGPGSAVYNVERQPYRNPAVRTPLARARHALSRHWGPDGLCNAHAISADLTHAPPPHPPHPPPPHPTHPQTYAVEADASSATYALAIAAITGGSVTVDGVGRDSLQGDAQFCKVR